MKNVRSTKFLAMYIDRQLIWKCHIAYISCNLAISNALFYKVSHVFDTDVFISIYNAY